MKVLLICGAFAVGVVCGAWVHRYEHVSVFSNWPARFDRWTGKLEIVKPSMADEPAAPNVPWPGTPTASEPGVYVPNRWPPRTPHR